MKVYVAMTFEQRIVGVFLSQKNADEAAKQGNIEDDLQGYACFVIESEIKDFVSL